LLAHSILPSSEPVKTETKKQNKYISAKIIKIKKFYDLEGHDGYSNSRQQPTDVGHTVQNLT
jgi:hypothetical protein